MAAPTASGQEPGWLAYYARKVRRHIHWARTEGVARLVEEDRLDPRERLQTAWRKARWRRRHGLPPGSAVPVYVVWLQRSGTNMLMRGVDLAPEVEVRNENDRTVFRRFSLRSDAVLAQTVRDSRHALVLVKPLCESHRVDELLDLAGVPAGRALWVFREPGARVRSFDTAAMTPETAAVLFWVVRNQLYFDLGLDRRDDVLLVSYDDFVAEPGLQMRRLCAFTGLLYRPALCEHVVPRESHGTDPLEVDPRVAALAGELLGRLRAAAAVPR